MNELPPGKLRLLLLRLCVETPPWLKRPGGETRSHSLTRISGTDVLPRLLGSKWGMGIR
jgi:hypothetical protein